MALRPVYTIKVDDEQFKKFKELFDKYQAAVKALPRDWKTVAGAVGVAAEAHGPLSETLQAQVAAMVAQELAAQRISQAASSTDSSWTKAWRKFQDLDTALQKNTVKLAKWSALATGVLGGLGALGITAGLWGIDRLAANVAATRRTAMGLGTTYGQLQSANVNMTRLISPTSLLQGAATGRYDITSPEYTALMMAGVSQRTLKYGTTADIAVEVLTRLPAIFQNVPENARGAIARYYGIDQLMPMSDINAYLNATKEERDRMLEAQKSDSKDLGMSDSDARKWADFVTQMDLAGKTIETVFMTKLAALEPGLESLSKSVTDVIAALANSGLVKSAVDGLALGLNDLADYMKTDSFQATVKDFTVWVGDAAKKLWDFIVNFNLITPNSSASNLSHDASGAVAYLRDAHGNLTRIYGESNKFGNPGTNAPPMLRARGNKGVGGWWTDDRIRYAVDRIQKETGATQQGAEAIVARWAGVEAPGGPTSSNAINGGHWGIGQWSRERGGPEVGQKSFEDQVSHAINELNTSEKAAGDVLRHATTDEEGARGASMFERGEGYNKYTGIDNYTYVTPVGKVHKVIIRNSSGNDPVRAHQQSSNPSNPVPAQ